VESKWKNYHIITFPGQSLSKNRETQFGRGYGPVARPTNTWTWKLVINLPKSVYVCVSVYPTQSLLGNGSVKIPLSLLGNSSVQKLPR
jgi:hypothetical protein